MSFPLWTRRNAWRAERDFLPRSAVEARGGGSPNEGARGGTTGSRTPSRSLPDPFLAADVELLLPERHRCLGVVDRLASGVDRRRTVRRRDGDDDARLADLDRPDAMVDRDVDHLLPVPQPARAPLHLPLGPSLLTLLL